MSDLGLDYSAWRPPSAGWLIANGYRFAVRYLKVLPNSYAIDWAEYAALRAAGVEVVLNWEEDTNDWQTDGVSYAQQAMAQAKALSAWPCPIYFSVDTGSPNMAQVDRYFGGVASVLGPEWTGIYGGFDTVTGVNKAFVTWFWQTYAWSGGRWANVHLRQIPGGSSNYDLDQAMVPNFGQVGAPGPAPDPPPDPPDPPSPPPTTWMGVSAMPDIVSIVYENNLQTFSVNKKGDLVHRYWTGSAWQEDTPPILTGCDTSSTPSVVLGAQGDPARIDVLIPGAGGNQLHAYWANRGASGYGWQEDTEA